MLLPGGTGAKKVASVSVNSVASKLMTASAPSGIGAPVRIFAHCPGATGFVGTAPAGISSVTRSVTGVSLAARARSALRKA